MSLINEALRKARLEAARQEASRRGLAMPAGEEPRRKPSLLPLVAIVAVLAAVSLVGGLLYWLGTRSAQETPPVALASDPLAGPGAPIAATEAPVISSGGTETEATTTGPPPRPQEPPAPPLREPVAARTPPPAAIPADDPPPSRPRATTAARSVEPPAVGSAAAGEPPTPTRPVVAPDTSVAESAPPGSPSTARGAAPPEDRPVETEPVRAEQIEPPPLAEPVAAGDDSTDESAAEVFVGEGTIGGVGEFRLGGIAWSERQPFALINGRVVGPGDSIQGLRVREVGRREVVLATDAGALYVLRLR